MEQLDYSNDLKRSAETGIIQTTEDVLPDDIPKLTRRLRNQARKLGLEIEIRTNKQTGEVRFLCRRSA